MNFATAIDRIRGDFEEMPTLELTVGQAVRFWHLGADDCRYVVDALVDAGFLRWTAKRTIVRADHLAPDNFDGSDGRSYIPVPRFRRPDSSRGNL